MKSKITMALVVSLLLSMFNFSVMAEDDISAENESNKINMAFDMGIFTEDDGDRLLDENVTRINLLIAMYRLMNYDNVDNIPIATKQYYSDIGLYHYGAGYAQAMTECGFVNGYGDGTYGADRVATLNECVTVLLRSAGYTDYFKLTNKAPYDVASDLGLLKSVKKGSDEFVTRRDMALILYNLMFIKCFTIDNVSGDRIKLDAGNEYIKEVLKLNYTDGVIDGINGISLYTETAEDVISVNGTSYSMKSAFPDSYLGNKARVIFDEDNGEAISVITDDRNKTVTLKAEDIVKYENNSYYYQKSERTVSTAKLRVSRTFDAVYNRGVLFDDNYMVPQYGNVVLIDNNNDSEYDVVIITDYESYITEGYSDTDNTIILKNIDENGKNKKIELNGYKSCKIVNDIGKPVEVTAINPGSVLTVLEPINKESIYITICENTVSGNIEQIYNDDGRTQITANGKIYYTIPDYYISGWQLVIGVNADMYIDANGRIAGFVKGKQADEWQYAYIRGAYYDSDEECAVLRLFTENNKFENVACDEKLMIDGEKTENQNMVPSIMENVYEQFETAEITGYTTENNTKWMVRYYLNGNGKIKKIDTPIMQSLYETSIPDGFSKDNCFMLRSKGYVYWKNGQRTFKTITSAHMEIAGDIYGQENMKVCHIPQDIESAEDEEYMWKPLTSTSFSEIYYYASGYNTAVDSDECTVLAIRNKTGTSTKKMMVIDKMGEMLDNDDVVKSVSGYVGSAYKTLPVKEGTFAKTDSLRAGDVIFYDYVDGKASIRELGYSKHDEGTLDTSDTYHPDDGGTHFNIPYRIIKGKITRVTKEHMQVTPANQATEMMGLPATVIIYNSKNGRVTTGNIYDVRTVQAYGDEADIVFISTRSGTIDEMIAIR